MTVTSFAVSTALVLTLSNSAAGFAPDASSAATSRSVAGSASTPTASVPDGQRAGDTATAVAIAKQYDHPVADDSQTTQTAQVSAEPDGSFQLQSDTLPVRVQQGSSWVPVDSALTYGADQMLTPVAAAAPVEFSEGGSDVMAKVEVTPGSWLTESWPYGDLPAPLVSDNDATYPNVLPGVDLRLSSTAAGMAEVLIVKSAAAASNPQLDQVRLALHGATVTPSTGNLLAVTPDGAPVQDATTAAAESGTVSSSPVWWDSTVKASGPDGPSGAEEAQPMTQTATSSDVTLNVGAVVDSQTVTYPLYVDPDWSAGVQAYWFTDGQFPDTVYLNGNANSGGIQAVGYAGPTPTYLSHAFWQFDTSFLHNKHILSASFNTSLFWSNQCTAKAIQAWEYGNGSDAPGFTWNQEPNAWDLLLDTQTVNYGSSCAEPNSVGFNAMQGAVNAAAGGWPNLQIGLRAANESDAGTRKHFGTTASLIVGYNSFPSQPTNLAISSPPRGCGTAASPAYLNGTAAITLQALTSDPDVGQQLGTAFYVTNLTSHTNAFSGMPYAGSALQSQGVQSVWLGPNTFADGTSYSWYAQSEDTIDWGQPSGLCYFTIDDTPPSQPTISVSASSGTTITVGAPITATFTQTKADDHATAFAYWSTTGRTGWSADGKSTTAVPAYPVSGNTLWSPNSAACTGQPVPQGPVKFVCVPPGSASASVTLAPRDQLTTLWVISFDLAGNASTPFTANGTTPAAASGKPVSASPDTVNVSYAKGHGWITDFLTSPVASIPDTNVTAGTSATAGKPLAVGAGTAFTTGNPGGFTGSGVFSLPGLIQFAQYNNNALHAGVAEGNAPAGYHVTTGTPLLGQMIPATSVGQTPPTGTQELYSCATSHGDMTSLQSTCEGTGVTGQPLGFSWTQRTLMPAGYQTLATQVFRCLNGTDHFDTTNSNCDGWTSAGSLGWFANVAPTSTSTAGKAVDTMKSFSVSAWLEPSGNNVSSQNYTAMSQTGALNSGFYLQQAAGNVWRFCVRSQNPTNQIVTDCASSSAQINPNTWYYVTGIWDVTNNEVRLLVGDSIAPVGTAAHTSPAGDVTAAGALTVGSAFSNGSPVNQWGGAINDPQIFPGVLDGTQLDQLMNDYSLNN